MPLRPLTQNKRPSSSVAAAGQSYVGGAFHHNRAATSHVYSSEGGAAHSDVRDLISLRDELNSDPGLIDQAYGIRPNILQSKQPFQLDQIMMTSPQTNKITQPYGFWSPPDNSNTLPIPITSSKLSYGAVSESSQMLESNTANANERMWAMECRHTKERERD